MKNAPMICEWDGDALVPHGIWKKRADEVLVVGERYTVETIEQRSIASHNFYFAALHEAWMNLPENLADQFPSFDKLRKHALIKAGYRDERSIVCASKAEALRVAAFVDKMDDYAIIIVRDALVIAYTAKSQSMKAMGKKDFRESKEAVLDIVAAMVKASRDELERNAGQAA